MATLTERWLEIADDLIAKYPRSSAAKRRAVSTAYYAAFHELALHCADELLDGVDRSDPRYERVFRALEHGAIKQAFQTVSSPLKTKQQLQEIGELLVALRSERFRADYLPPIPNLFSRARSAELVDQARDIVRRLGELSDDDRRSLAAYLLFKDVRS